MATTNFVDRVTPINASWLNDVDSATYEGGAVFTPAGTGAVATTVQAKLRESVSVKDFGAVGDGATDDTDAIQAAIDAAPAEGGTVYFPAGIYLVSATIVANVKGLTLEGEGGNYYFGSTNQNAGSILKWVGSVGGTVLTVTPKLTTEPSIAPTLRNLSIDGQGGAAVGLRVEACVQGVFEKLSIRHCTTAGIHTGSTSLVGFTGLNYVHSCTFDNIWLDQFLTGDGAGLLLDGTLTTTTTVCTFKSIYIHHLDGNGITLQIADSNLFQGVFIGRGDTGLGIGVEFKGTTAAGKAVNSNTFVELVAGKGGVVSRAGTPPGFNAAGNVIYGLGMDTGNPLPVIENGSNLFYQINFDANDNTNTGGFNILKIHGSNATPIQFGASATPVYGIDFTGCAFSGAMMRLRNNTPVSARNGADTGNIELFRVNAINEWAQAVHFRLNDGVNILPGSTTGTLIGNVGTQKLGFWGKAPTTQPAAIADTASGVAATIEAEVNKLKALLRSIGLMAT